MPRRSIILQELEQNEKKLTSYNQAVAGYNAEAESRNANYNNQVNEYNAFVNSVKAGQQLAVGEYAPGAYTLLKGYSDSNGVVGITPYSADKRGNPQMAGALVDKLPTDNTAGLNGVYLRNPDGTATFHSWNSGTDLMGGTIEGAAPGWQNTGYSARIMEFNTPAPTPPPTPAEPDFYSMSRREEQELTNPTATTAEATLAANKGLPVKTNLADQASSGASVYAERDRDQAIEQSGILARVLSGKLA